MVKRKKRIVSIDIMRGITLFLMLFVNDLYVPGVPAWLAHTAAETDGMGLADWVFPGFLFMVGLSIPFAYKARIRNNPSENDFLLHIIIRTLSLLFIGVLIVNISRLNPELSGMPKTVWALGIYVGIFLIWNKYPESVEKYQGYLKALGVVIISILLFKFKAGSAEEPSWIETSWWGILGLIGWGYLVSSLVYLGLKDSLILILSCWLLFVFINCLSLRGYTDFLNSFKPVFGVIINGNTPSIVLSGLFGGVLLVKFKEQSSCIILTMITAGVVSLSLGFFLRNWFIISKIQATPSWGLICSGISFLLFALLYFLIDVKEKESWFSLFKPAGENSLTTYLAPDIFYYLIWTFGLNILIYKQDSSPFLAVGGSLLWAFLMIKWASFLAKNNIRLKL